MKKSNKKKHATRAKRGVNPIVVFLKKYFIAVFLVSIGVYIAFPDLRSVEPVDVCANSISCIKDLSGIFKHGQNTGVFIGKKVTVPSYVAKSTLVNPVLGANTENKVIYIDLSKQHLYTFEGNTLVHDFPVSTGKWGATPTGTFSIWAKLRYTRMTGGNQAIGTYYDLPNVPYTMFFYNDTTPKTQGFGIHGAYWHNNFGHPMSHGCINMRIEDSEKIYYWSQPAATNSISYATAQNTGTKIVIYGETPNE